MDYSLAKKLKDAGFPLPDRRCSYCIEQSYVSCTVCEDAVEAHPTLTELIEACFDREKSFQLAYEPEQEFTDATWGASIIRRDGKIDTHIVFGSTPEEAVATLWLELNKKV